MVGIKQIIIKKADIIQMSKFDSCVIWQWFFDRNLIKIQIYDAKTLTNMFFVKIW